MKNKIKIGLILVLFLYHGIAMAQSIAFKANYSIKTTTSYHVSEAFADSITLYDKVKLMPLTVEDTYDEVFYDDGSVEKEVLHFYPDGLPEEWLKKPEKTVFTKDSAFIYVNGSVFTSLPLTNDTLNINEVVPYYLGSPEFGMPLNSEQVVLLEQNEVNVVTNNPMTLLYEFGNTSMMYNSAFMAREICEYDGTKKISSYLTIFKRDGNGRLIYDYTVKRILNCENSSIGCVEKVIVSKYNNMIREYVDPSLAPEEINSTDSIPFISASKLGATNGVIINFSENCPDQIIVNIKDLYGNLKEANILVTKQNNTIFPQNLQLGLYVVEVLTPNVQSCTFMYTP